MTTTPRVGATHVESSDTLAGGALATAWQAKINDALNRFDAGIGRVICTSTTRPTTDMFPGKQAYETDTRQNIINQTGVAGAANWRYESPGAAGAGAVRSYRPIRPYGGDTAHSAFPGVAVLANNKVVMVWRVGSNHTGIYDGVIYRSVSTNMGKTWSAGTFIWSGIAGTDYRDPCISLSRSGTRLHLSYFKANATNTAAGVFYRYSDDEGVNWSAEVRVDNLMFRAAVSAPPVELDNGTIVIPFYGRGSGETWESCWTTKSTDAGATWSIPVKILNGEAAGSHRQEPYVVMKGQTGVMAYRHGTASQIGVSTTADNTANWSGGVAKFSGTGRPALCWVNNDALACVYRSLSNGDALIRTSRDNGANWTPPRLVEPAWNSGGWMTYAAMDRVSPDSAIMIMGNEAASTQSRIFISYVGESGAVTPFGALPSEQDVVWNNEDNKIFATNFEQTNGALVYPWYSLADASTVIDGELQSASNNNVPDIVGMYTGVNDMEVEADLYTSGPEVGFAVIFRMVSATTYLMFTVESSGAAWRLYKVVSGTPTQLFSVTGAMNFGAYHTYKVIARGNGIWCYVNDLIISPNSANFGQGFYSHQLSGGDFTTFQNGRFAGVKLNSQSTTVHKCRRFSVKG